MMDREQAIDALIAAMRQKLEGSEWLRRTLAELVAAGKRDAFHLQCMSMARQRLDGTMPDGSVEGAVDRLWREMGGAP